MGVKVFSLTFKMDMIVSVLLSLTIFDKNVFFVFCKYYGLNIGILPKFVFLCSNPNYDGI